MDGASWWAVTGKLTLDEVAALVGMHRGSLARLAAAGNLPVPARKIGEQWRFDADEVAALVGLTAEELLGWFRRPTVSTAPVVTIHRLAELERCSVSTLNRMASRGDLPGLFRLGDRERRVALPLYVRGQQATNGSTKGGHDAA
jgi:excisionase family DNA binding protein